MDPNLNSLLDFAVGRSERARRKRRRGKGFEVKAALTLAVLTTAVLVIAQPMSASAPQQAQGTEITRSANDRFPGGRRQPDRRADRNPRTRRNPVRAACVVVPARHVQRRLTALRGLQTCDPCVVDGRTGTVVFRLQAHTTERTVVTQAELTIVDATGGLEGLHRILKVTGNTYTGVRTTSSRANRKALPPRAGSPGAQRSAPGR